LGGTTHPSLVVPRQNLIYLILSLSTSLEDNPSQPGKGGQQELIDKLEKLTSERDATVRKAQELELALAKIRQENNEFTGKVAKLEGTVSLRDEELKYCHELLEKQQDIIDKLKSMADRQQGQIDIYRKLIPQQKRASR